MKLHLPKLLLTAVLAACVVTQTAWAETSYWSSASGEKILENDSTSVSSADKVVIGSEANGVITYADLKINGKISYGGDHANGHILTLQGEIDASGCNLGLESGAKLIIDGGTLNAKTLTLGHNTDDSTNHSYWGAISMSSGSITTGTITLNRSHKNDINITGGALEFTTETAITRGNNTLTTVKIVGADSEHNVTLKAKSVNWTLDGTGLTSTPTVGNITIDAENSKMITIKKVHLTGDIINNATSEGAGLTLTGVYTASEGFVKGGTQTYNSSTGVTSVIRLVGLKGDGSYDLSGVTSINDYVVAADSTWQKDENGYYYATATSNLYHVYDTDPSDNAVTTVKVSDVGVTASNANFIGYEVHKGAKLEADAQEVQGLTVYLNEGAILSKTEGGAGTETTRQFDNITLKGNAEFNNTKLYGLLASSYAKTTLDLGGYTLKKTGNGVFLLMNTEVKAGTIDVQAGELKLVTKNANGRITLADGVQIKVAAGAHVNVATTTLTSAQLLGISGAGEVRFNATSYTLGSGTSALTGTGALIAQSGTLTLDGTEAGIVRTRGGNAVIGTGSEITNMLDVVTGTGEIQSGATVKGAIVSGAGTLNISGGKIGYVKATTGTVNLTGTGVTVGQWDTALNFDSTHVAGIYATDTSAVNIGNGTDVSTITATRLEMGDTRWVGNGGNPNETGSNMASGGTLNVKSNATLVITGADVAPAGNDQKYHATAIVVGEWGGKSILNIDGKLLAQNASVANGDTTGVINVKNGGMLAVKGLKNQTSARWGAITLNLEEGGTLILGTGGIDTQKFSSKLDAGTIGISAEEVAIAENLVLSNTETGTSFDTTMYTWSDDGATITQGTKGGKLTISGVISDYSVTTGTEDEAVTTTTAGKLVVKGEGELHLTAANTYTGGTEVQSGKLVAATGQALGSNGSITISGGSLEVTSDNVTITKSGANNATITCVTDSEHQQNTTGVYSLGSDGSQVNDAIVEVANNSAEKVTVSNRLVNVELVNNGTATIEAGNGYNDFTAISALKGDITLEGLGNQANNGNVDTVSSLTIGAGHKLTAYQAWDEGAKATVKVEANGTATFGAEAQMAANLELGTGTELTLAGALNMGSSTLTLGQSLTLDETTLNSILNMSGDRLDLFTNVSSLILGTDPYAMGTDILDDTTNVALGTWFTLPDSEVAMLSNTTTPTAGSFYLGYDANGTVYAGKVVPEPTTATLSLLALAGLAARRRRK